MHETLPTTPLAILGYRKDGRPIRLQAGGAPDDTTTTTGDSERRAALSLEDLRGKTPEELYELVGIVDAHLKDLHQDERGGLRDLDEAEQSAFDTLMEVRAGAEKRLAEHRQVQEVFKRRPQSVERALFAMGVRDDDPFSDVRRLTPAEARERALRRLDDRSTTSHMSGDQKTEVERQLRRDPDIARRILVTETDAYRTAWMKLTTQPDAQLYLTDEEREAVRAFNEYRAAAEWTSASGGFGIPVFIDPSIILTAQESGNPFLTLARQVTVNTNQWKGVSSAGVSWAFQTEAAAVTDNAPTLAQPTVTVHMARGFIPYSIEVGQDYPAFADEMAQLLAAGYDELLVDKFTRGSGSGEPQGIVTALSANTNVRVKLGTAGTLAEADPYSVWKALPQKFRRRAAWMMSVGVNNAVRRLGTANVFHAFTENLPAEWADILFGKTVYESPYMNDTPATTTSNESLAVVGDWANFVIARRGGMSVELVPQIFDVTANRPTGQRGWFAYARIGAGSVNDLGFRVLTNVT
jgi:HK97 family phage major capsid protein